MTRFLILTVTLLALRTVTSSNLDILSDKFIDFINSNQSLWKAGRNFRRDIPLSYINLLAGTIRGNLTETIDLLDDPPLYKVNRTDSFTLPEQFDIRQQWPNCPILNNIRDQGSCGSCWAVAAVAAMTDRYCIASKGNDNFNFAAGDVLSCCLQCGSGCNGGQLSMAWLYCKRKGIVSGGEYESEEGCQPYQIPQCDHRYAPDQIEPCGHNVVTPTCKETCHEAYGQSYYSDKKKCKFVYPVKKEDVMNDIYTLGPVTTSFDVYADFLNYKSGIYYHVTGKLIGGHSVKVMGWGVENGVKYWLMANTWNEDWGDKGFFKIIRDRNECGIEDLFVAGT